jgi:hypothetical protein
MARITFHPVHLERYRNEDLRKLSAACEFAYATGGPATHIAFTPYDEVIMLFPTQGEDGDKWRVALVFKTHYIDKFIEVMAQGDSAAGSFIAWACPDEWELPEDRLTKDGDIYKATINVSLYWGERS